MLRGVLPTTIEEVNQSATRSGCLSIVVLCTYLHDVEKTALDARVVWVVLRTIRINLLPRFGMSQRVSLLGSSESDKCCFGEVRRTGPNQMPRPFCAP